MVNKDWCDSGNIKMLSCSCSPDLELLTIKCRPHFLPREFTSVSLHLTTGEYRGSPVGSLQSLGTAQRPVILMLRSLLLETLIRLTSRKLCLTSINILTAPQGG